ncbi:unnamed protein product [Plutella xylostella]|uniref:(diamondback moth) hypothetical protein n=1 Tax=Plutella xylostella TaxID=51655 RepID=A0A8S4FRX5_PLUXY|nr:unnamed protein product [Plutella xylostella]
MLIDIQTQESPITSVVRKGLVATARGCSAQVGAVDSDLEHLRGDPPFPEKAACVVKCLLNKVSSAVRGGLVATARGCSAQVGAADSDLEHLRGDPPFPEKAACVVKCLLNKIGIVKNDKYSKSGFLTLITPLVMANKKKLEHMKSVADNCDKEVNHKEAKPCQLGNEITACIFKYAPELHFNKRVN